jgi:membrane protein implicated in regulation of membrane protease activity
VKYLKVGWLAAGALIIAILVVAVLLYARYRRDMGAAQVRLQSSGSQVIETESGPIEYATFGEDAPVLVTIRDGGHMLLGHEEQVRSEVVTFLAGILDR